MAGWIRSWPYATASRGGSPDYYKLTLLGYRLLHGANASPPTKRYFNEIGIAHQHHTHGLAEFLVHTVVGAHRQGIALRHYYRENSLRLQVGQEHLYPDCTFELHAPDGRRFNFLVELDNGTERIESVKDADSWQRKIRLYEEYQDKIYPHRFRVLAIATRSVERLQHILALASGHAKNPRRSLLYAISLNEYLLQADPIQAPCFRDHRETAVPLIPPCKQSEKQLPSPGSPSSGNLFPLPAATRPP
jgi:hypothetical protein